MSAIAADLARILSAVVAQIGRLTDDEVRALVAGEAEFRLVPKKSTTRTTPAPRTQAVHAAADAVPAADLAEVRDTLRACASESEAGAYLARLRLTPATAKALATGLGLRLPARPSVAAITAEIVRVFVAGRLNAATVQRL